MSVFIRAVSNTKDTANNNTFEHEMGRGGAGREGWCRMTLLLAPIQDTDGVAKLGDSGP